jgi:outer membrane protein assembly factor BamB
MPAVAENWPQWRGPQGTGVSTETGLPLQWSETENIAWKCPLPGMGASTPAVWGNAVFVTSEDGDKLLLLKTNKTTGQVEWTQQVGTGVPARRGRRGADGSFRKQQKFHNLHNLASPSPVTDGEVVIAHFGNGDLAAYDFAGKRLWLHNLQKEHGTYTIWWGHANSPVLSGDLVISVCMQDSLADLQSELAPSYLVAHDKRTGEQKWKTKRETGSKAEDGDSYTTPLLYERQGRRELLVVGANHIDAYDPTTGRQLWDVPGIEGSRTITGPTLGAGLVYATGGKRGPLVAAKLGGDIVWKHAQGTPDTPCPVLWKDWLFTVSDQGIAQCFDAHNGELLWKERLPTGDYKASPLAADGKIYFLNLKGGCTVLKAGPRFEKLAENHINDETIASLAVSGGKVFVRGKKALYCVGNVK